jgi:hypothetical protein
MQKTTSRAAGLHRASLKKLDDLDAALSAANLVAALLLVSRI